jgi:hypothetical protein
MKRWCLPLVFVALATSSFGAVAPPHSIKDIPTADESLRRAVSPKMYRSLQISPIKGWVVARGQLAGDRLTATRIVRSDLGGAYDALALELAENLHILGDTTGGIPRAGRQVSVHVLLYEIADGRLAVSFAKFDDADASQWRHYGAAWMAVQKADDTWVKIEHSRISRYEHRGPRTYTIGVAAPGPRRAPFTPDVSWQRRFQR